jgi:hypothetical protein
MEQDLSKTICHLRDLGIPVETYMVEEEAQNILKKLFPWFGIPLSSHSSSVRNG